MTSVVFPLTSAPINAPIVKIDPKTEYCTFEWEGKNKSIISAELSGNKEISLRILK